MQKIGDSEDALTITPRRKFPQFIFIINDKKPDAKF